MSEQPQMQVVLQKSAAELEEERRVEHRRLLMKSLGALINADENVEGENEDAERHDNDYNRIVELDGNTWLATYGYYSRHYLQNLRQPEGRIIVIPSNILVDEQGDGERLGDSYTAINITELFAGKREDIASMIMGLSKAGDPDVDFTLAAIMQHGKYDVEWPALETTAKAQTLADVFILLAQAKKDGVALYDHKADHVGKVHSVTYVPPSMFQSEYVTWKLEGAASLGGKIYRGHLPGYCTAGKVFGADLTVRPATQEQIKAGAEKGKETHELLSGEGEFAHLMYKGLGLTPGFWGSKVPHAVDSRVVIDPEGLRLMDMSRMTALLGLMDMDIVEEERGKFSLIKDVTEIDLAGMANASVIYDLSKSVWMLGEVRSMTPIKYREDAFDRLVLDSQRKRLVEALVVHNGAIREGTPDIIDGKGGGCIFLLDGPPGTGKTLTAEATAEKLQRVLYKVGLGELGVDAQTMEKKLSQVLSTAARWNAVLLLDEADVFLEKRSTENLQRNAMVAVFLRLLEYYNGILFLTTNRGDNFDPAVLSRVTLALHFVAQNADGRRTIWTNLLANAGIEVTAVELTNLAGIPVNGREIKNAINSSRALAAADKTGVTYQHLREIMDAAALFAQEVTGKRD